MHGVHVQDMKQRSLITLHVSHLHWTDSCFVCQAIIHAQCVTRCHVPVPSDVHTVAAVMIQHLKTGVCCCMAYLKKRSHSLQEEGEVHQD